MKRERCHRPRGLCAKIGLFQSSKSVFGQASIFCTKTHCWRVESCAQPQAAVLARHGHRRSPRPEHRHLAISKSAHCTAGLRRIVYGTRCAVSSNRSLSIAFSSSRAATARQRGPKRLLGSVGGRPACAMVRKRKAPEADRRALPPHSSRSGGSPRRRSSTHQTPRPPSAMASSSVAPARLANSSPIPCSRRHPSRSPRGKHRLPRKK